LRKLIKQKKSPYIPIAKARGFTATFGKYGFEVTRVLLVPHGGWHNDTIVTVEVKTSAGSIAASEEW